MYSVEDLLISHGYKLPTHATASPSPTPNPASSRHAPLSSPPSYSIHHEILENRPSPGAVNGYGRGSKVTYGTGGGTRQPQGYGGSCPNNNFETRDRSQSRQEGESRSQMDAQSFGESLTSDSGFCDGTRGKQPQPKDVSFWRRRGQDFSVLLDYADYRGSHRSGQGGYIRPQGPQQARCQVASAEERQGIAQERQCWAAQAQAQVQAQAQARSREREAALNQWKMATERKCQSLGTDEWRPVVSFGRQLSQSEVERWSQEQHRFHARTPEGMVVHPRTKAKSQSLPRMLQPESLQYVDIVSSGQELYRRVNCHPLSHHDFYITPRWPENGRPASANQLSMTPKPRFTRPPRPPSYEMHQQIRGSCDMLSGRDSVVPRARDRTPLPMSKPGDTQMDYYAQESGPPGYIPPPSYKRAPMIVGGRPGYGEIAVDYRYSGDVYQHIQVAPDGAHWLTRHPAGSWPKPQRECQKHLYPVYTTQECPGGGVQYIPFDDPRIRHISSALGGNSLTDADKIRHIRNELPCVTTSEPPSDNSAFLPPPLGPHMSAKMAVNAHKTASSDFDNDSSRWHSNLHKENVDNFPATDQNCNNRYSKNQRPPPSPSSAFQAQLQRAASCQGSSSDQVFAKTITQVKKIVPESRPEKNRNTKRRVSETIFCLVSVPVHTPTILYKNSTADQNNNETVPDLTVTNTDTFTVGLRETHNLRSKSVNEMPINPHHSHFYPSSTSSMRNYKRAPLRKEIIDAWSLQVSEDKQMCYAGSWPGNQYRNQETQTGSPLTVSKSPEPQSPPGGQEPVQSSSDTTTDSGVGTDNCSSYSYSMAGQKNLHPSSNSAFSRLSLSPTQLPTLQVNQEEPSSPPKEEDQGGQNPSIDNAKQKAFGQFLLKPVNRRPCDAIFELESINKEMEETISNRPNGSRCTDDIDDNNKLARYRKGALFTAGPDPGREAISLPTIHTEKSNIKVRSKSFPSATDLDSMYRRSGFSRQQTNKTPPINEICLITNSGLRHNGLLPSLPLHSESSRLYRQDIPVPQESLLRDVGLTVYTESPGGPRELMQRSLSVPPPLHHKERCQSVQPSWESETALIKSSGSPKHNLNLKLQAKEETERMAQIDGMPQSKSQLNVSICRTQSSSCISPKTKGAPHEDNIVDERYTMSEPLTYENELTIADKHLENLLIQEKANALPVEDLSNLYEVKCAQGIPENESIEQRAARILGIAIPVEALGVTDKQLDANQDDGDPTLTEGQKSRCEETSNVIEEHEQVVEESLEVETKEVKVTALRDDHKEDRQKHISKHNNDKDYEDTDCQSAVVLGLPEFPPSKLPLSLPITPNEKLALSMCSGEKKGCDEACKQNESLQDKLSSSAFPSAASLNRSTTDRDDRLKELDTVSPIRQLILRSCESRGEDGSEERGGDEEESGVQEKIQGEVKEDEHKNPDEERCKMEEPKEDCKPEEENEEMGKVDERPKEEVEEVDDMFALEAKTEEVQEDVKFKKKVSGEAEFKIADTTAKPLETVRNEQNATEVSRAEAVQDSQGEKLSKAKQKTRLQKPPLLPKPRSVPKREITLSLSISPGNCGPSNMEEMLSVSDSYDPSRVEKV
ncbi:uncharacterized protein jcada [Aulostomus maculatus]